jgi:hypothetical protein
MNIRFVSAALLFAACGAAASAQIAVDGQLSQNEQAFYGNILFVQSVPTQFGDNTPVAGCNNSDLGNPAAVNKGIELVIPLASIGNPTVDVKIMAFINSGGHGSVSNQVLPPLPALSLAPLGNPRALDFSAIAGNQFAVVSVSGGPAITADGLLDAGAYGAPLAIQANRTTADDDTDASNATASGSELDVMYGVIRDGNMHVFLGGNLQSNFTKIEIFIDSAEGGVNQLVSGGNYADVDFGALQNLQGNAEFPGLRFDSGFSPDYYMTFGCGNDPVTHFPNFTLIEGAANPGYLGNRITGSGSGLLEGGNNPDNIQVAVDNGNTEGVGALCPPPQGDRDRARGSEIDGAYAYLDVANGYLNVLVTGNVESNYNKLDLFFDVNGDAEGQNAMRSDNVDIDFNHLNTMAGLTFDSGFTADYWLSLGNGDNGLTMFANAAVLRANGPAENGAQNHLDYGAYNGGTKANGNDPINFDGPRADVQDGFAQNIFTEFAPRTTGLPYLSGGSAPNPVADLILITLDNRNVQGVTSAEANPAAAAAVRTGVEVRISLAELGWDGTSCIKIAGCINNGDRNFMSNQVIGGLPAGTGNLGNPANINFANIPGNQFVEICPPVSCAWRVDGCFADYNNDEGIDGDDVIAFFADWDTNRSCADVDNSDGVDGDDVIAFFGAWDANGTGFPGC